jgi:hypothetical protein
MTAVFAMLAALCLYATSCLGGSDDAPHADGDSALSRWAAERDTFWDALQARDDARNAELEQPARDDIYGSLERYRASHFESPRTTGDVQQWGNPTRDRGDVIVVSPEVEDDFHRRHWESMRRRWAGKPDSFDADKEAEEAVRGGL